MKSLYTKPPRLKSRSPIMLPLASSLLGVAGCSQPDARVASENTSPDATSAIAPAAIAPTSAPVAEVPTSSATPSAEWSPEQSAPLKISDFIAALNRNKLPVTRKHQMFFELVKASDGSRLTIDHKDIEVYQVDASTEAGRKTLAVWREQGIFGYPTKVRKNLAIGNFEDHPKSKEIVAVFEGL